MKRLPLSIAALCLAIAPALAQAPRTDRQESGRVNEPAPAAPRPDANANAPKGPALAEEPHGGGSVYQELESQKQPAKDK